jgi:Tol biopolymer transport system component
VLTLNTDPRRLFQKGGPSSMSPAYFGRAADLARRGMPVFLQVAWPSEGSGGEADQVALIRDLPRLTGSLKPSMLAWTFLHDVRILKIFVGRLGLLTSDGKPKPALAAWRALAAGDRPAVASSAAPAATALPRLPRSASTTASRDPAQFAVFTARKDGSDLKILISDPEREMSHPRVSPDRNRVVITRYTRRGKDGKATEEQGYEGTEILVMNLDGSGLEVVVPARQGIVAANGCWTPDGKALMFISTDTPQRTPELRQVDLATRQVSRLPTPPGLKATDPHWEASKIVFPAKADEGKGADALWLMNADGSQPRQITRPPRSKSAPGLYGDFDPKISPDGSKIAFMRIDGGESWRVMVLDLDSGEEKTLTPPGVMQWLPTWSSDGKLLLYVHVDRKNPKDIGLYTMTPDGRDRRMIPLPRGYLYGHSTFFPGDGSSDSARIIFNGTPKAGL